MAFETNMNSFPDYAIFMAPSTSSHVSVFEAPQSKNIGSFILNSWRKR